MSISFDDASSEYLQVSANVMNTDVFTWSCWVNPDSLAGGDSVMMFSGNSAVTNQYYSFRVLGTSGFINFGDRNTANENAATTVGASVGVWSHALCLKRATDDREVYLNNGDSGTNTTTVSGLDGVTDSFAIGALRDSSPGGYFSGLIEQPAAWNIALDATDRQSLTNGVSPLLVKPQNLIFYRPMISLATHNDVLGGPALTEFNTPQNGTSSPRIYNPASNIIPFPTAAVGGATGKSNPLYGPMGGPLVGAM